MIEKSRSASSALATIAILGQPPRQRIGVIGASSFVGEPLLARLSNQDWQVTAFMRRKLDELPARFPSIAWREVDLSQRDDPSQAIEDNIPVWFYLAPIWTLPDYFDFLAAQGARRIVALSSTSVYTKGDSDDPGEREVARSLAEGEERLRCWAQGSGVIWTVLRPTLIYGQGRDRNISEIAHIIQKFGFFRYWERPAVCVNRFMWKTWRKHAWLHFYPEKRAIALIISVAVRYSPTGKWPHGFSGRWIGLPGCCQSPNG
jgi:hypothetical protein